MVIIYNRVANFHQMNNKNYVDRKFRGLSKNMIHDMENNIKNISIAK